MRNISTTLNDKFLGKEVDLFVAVELMFDSGALCIWSGIGDKPIGGQTYTGTGSLLSVSGIEESDGLSAPGASISLNGVDSSLVSLAMQEPYQNRNCRILLGSGNDFFEIFSGFMDVMTIEDSGETCLINLSVESRLIILDRKIPLRYTQETQNSRYPGDTFFSTVASLQDKKVSWNMGED